MNVNAKSSQQTSLLLANELVKDPSGDILCGPPVDKYPKFIRNGYFKSAMNTWTNPVSGISTMVFDGWFAKVNGAAVVNMDRGSPLQTDGWKSRFNAITTISSNPGPAASDFVILEQRCYDAVAYAGQLLTIDFQAKSSVQGTVIGVEFVLDEDNGTSTLVSAGVFILSTKVETFTAQAGLPPLSGVALGSLHNIKLRFWLYGGSDHTVRFGAPINSSFASISIGSIRDRSLSHEPSARDELLQVAPYFFKSGATQLMAAAGTSSFSATAIAQVTFPVPAAYVPAAANLSVTSSNVGTLTLTPSQFGFGATGVPNNPTSSARITGYTLNLELPA